MYRGVFLILIQFSGQGTVKHHLFFAQIRGGMGNL